MPFVVIEGLDGAGGETQTKLLMKYLKEKNIPLEFIKSPDYETSVGKVYKKYLNGEVEMEKDAVFLLVACDVIMNKPKIERAMKKTIIADRYITATIAYQCANGLSFEKATKFVELMEYPKPDLVIFIDIKPETSMKRKLKEHGRLDRHEKNLEFLRKVRNFYLKEIKENILSKWFIIDGERSIEEVHEDIVRIVEEYSK